MDFVIKRYLHQNLNYCTKKSATNTILIFYMICDNQ